MDVGHNADANPNIQERSPAVGTAALYFHHGRERPRYDVLTLRRLQEAERHPKETSKVECLAFITTLSILFCTPAAGSFRARIQQDEGHTLWLNRLHRRQRPQTPPRTAVDNISRRAIETKARHLRPQTRGPHPQGLPPIRCRHISPAPRRRSMYMVPGKANKWERSARGLYNGRSQCASGPTWRGEEDYICVSEWLTGRARSEQDTVVSGRREKDEGKQCWVTPRSTHADRDIQGELENEVLAIQTQHPSQWQSFVARPALVTVGEPMLRFTMFGHYIPVEELAAALVDTAMMGSKTQRLENADLRRRGQAALAESS